MFSVFNTTVWPATSTVTGFLSASTAFSHAFVTVTLIVFGVYEFVIVTTESVNMFSPTVVLYPTEYSSGTVTSSTV